MKCKRDLSKKKKKIKNMNSKMTTNSQLSTTEPKTTKTNKANNLNRNRITEMKITGRVISREGEGDEWGEVEMSSINSRSKGRLRIV